MTGLSLTILSKRFTLKNNYKVSALLQYRNGRLLGKFSHRHPPTYHIPWQYHELPVRIQLPGTWALLHCKTEADPWPDVHGQTGSYEAGHCILPQWLPANTNYIVLRGAV